MEEKKQLLKQFEQALANVCDLMRFERELQGTQDFEELMEDEDYRRLVSMQVRYFTHIRQIREKIGGDPLFSKTDCNEDTDQ